MTASATFPRTACPLAFGTISGLADCTAASVPQDQLGPGTCFTILRALCVHWRVHTTTCLSYIKVLQMKNKTAMKQSEPHSSVTWTPSDQQLWPTEQQLVRRLRLGQPCVRSMPEIAAMEIGSREAIKAELVLLPPGVRDPDCTERLVDVIRLADSLTISRRSKKLGGCLVTGKALGDSKPCRERWFAVGKCTATAHCALAVSFYLQS